MVMLFVLDVRLSMEWRPPVPSALGTGADTGEISAVEPTAFSWSLERIHAPRAWEKTQGDEHVVVAVVDSGIDWTHPALLDRIWTNPGEIPDNGLDDDDNGYIDDVHGWDFIDQDADSLQGSKAQAHGTHVAGVIAARIDDSGISGVAPRVKLMDLRVLDGAKRLKGSEDLIQAIRYAVENGAKVINLSIQLDAPASASLKQAVAEAVGKGVTLVAAAGNNFNRVQAPANLEDVIAVAATDSDDRLAYFSSYGPEVEVAAPGVEIATTTPGGGFGQVSGTSFAAAHVSGTVALLVSLNPNLPVSQIRQRLGQSAHDIGKVGRDDWFGHGLVDAAELVNAGP